MMYKELEQKYIDILDKNGVDAGEESRRLWHSTCKSFGGRC